MSDSSLKASCDAMDDVCWLLSVAVAESTPDGSREMLQKAADRCLAGLEIAGVDELAVAFFERKFDLCESLLGEGVAACH